MFFDCVINMHILVYCLWFIAYATMVSCIIVTPFFINNPFLTLAPKIVEAFLKNRPQKLFSNCLVGGLSASIV